MLNIEVSESADYDEAQAADSWFEPAVTPSVTELLQLSEASGIRVRVLTARSPTKVEGIAVCFFDHAQIHGVKVKAYRLFGYKLHDYCRVRCSSPTVFLLLLEEMQNDAKRMGADVVCLDNLIAENSSSLMLGHRGATESNLQIFDATLEQGGWQSIISKKSVKRHLRKVKSVEGYSCQTKVGNISRDEIEVLASLHKERWGFDNKDSQFAAQGRISEYCNHLGNKVLTTVRLGAEILCCHYGMIYGDVLLWHTPVINIKYLDYSPLEVLLSETAEFCSENGIRVLDFGLGDESYKSRFSNASRTVYSLLSPITFRGWLARLAGKVARIKGIRKLGVSTSERLRLMRSYMSARSTIVYWYERKASFSGGEKSDSVSVFDSYDQFVDFCRSHNLDLERQHYERFCQGFSFAAIHDSKNVMSFGWIARGETFFISEIRKNVSLFGRVLFFDFFTLPAFRRQGWYTRLLKELCIIYHDCSLAIFAGSANASSNKAILNAGFYRKACLKAGRDGGSP